MRNKKQCTTHEIKRNDVEGKGDCVSFVAYIVGVPKPVPSIKAMKPPPPSTDSCFTVKRCSKLFTTLYSLGSQTPIGSCAKYRITVSRAFRASSFEGFIPFADPGGV